MVHLIVRHSSSIPIHNMNNEFICWSCGDLGKHNSKCKSSCKQCKWRCSKDNDGIYCATIRDKILGIGCNCNYTMSISVPSLPKVPELAYLEQIQQIATTLENQYTEMKKVASKDRISRLRIFGVSPRGLSQSLPEITS